MLQIHQTIKNLFEQGKYNHALKLLKKHAKKTPNDPEIKRLTGIAYIHLKNFKQAQKHLNSSLSIRPNVSTTLLNLASLYKEQCNFELAIETIEKVLKTEPNHAAAFFNLGNIYRLMERWEDASLNYQKVLQLNPNHLSAMVTMGLMKKNSGEIEEAIQLFHRALNIDPYNKSIYLSLANLKNYQFSENEINIISTIIKQSSDHESIELLFAKAQYLEHQARYKEAFEYLHRANQAQHIKINRTPYDWNGYSKRIIEVFDQDKSVSIIAGKIDQQPRPVFIVSMPRSGSTLVEQILASHSAVFGASEIQTFPQLINQIEQQKQSEFPEAWLQTDEIDLNHMAESYRDKIHSYGKHFEFITDKNLVNFNYIGAILNVMPDSLFIHCVRHPMDVCLSCYKQLFNAGQDYSYDLEELADYYNHHSKIMSHWKQLYPNQILTVEYEKLIENFKPQINKMLNFLNLPWDDSCLNFHKTKRVIKTASAAQVKQKIYKSASHRYKKYGSSLDSLKSHLKSFL